MKKHINILFIFLMVVLQAPYAFSDQENLRRCLDGNYPSLCKYHLLTASQKAQARDAERQVNLRRCLDGNYPTLCKYNLLSSDELKQAKEAERQVNLRRCLDGNYPTLCKYNMLSQGELKRAKEAERQVNLRRCLDGNYPTLCNYGLLSEQEKQAAKKAEAGAEKRQKENAARGGSVPRSRSGACYESSIVKPSPFMGNDGEIFKLDDGSLWEVKYEYEYLYEYYPDVIVCPSKGKLVIDGKSLNVEHVGGN